MKTIILGIGSGIGGPEVVILLTIVFLIGLPLIALVNALGSNFKQPVDKITWVLVIILLPIVGAIIYFANGNKNKVIDNP